jgi:hypothetical protein
LTDAIVRLVDDAQLRDALGKRARIRWEQEYTIERAHDAYRATYQDLIRPEFLVEPHMPQSEVIKRLVDIVGSASLLLMLTPLFLPALRRFGFHPLALSFLLRGGLVCERDILRCSNFGPCALTLRT